MKITILFTVLFLITACTSSDNLNQTKDKELFISGSSVSPSTSQMGQSNQQVTITGGFQP